MQSRHRFCETSLAACSITPAGKGLQKLRAAQKAGDVGSYWLKFKSGLSCIGKGTVDRMKSSAARIKKAYGDIVDWAKSKFKPAKNNCPKEALKSEAKDIEKAGGLNPAKLYNEINSPGKKLLEEGK